MSKYATQTSVSAEKSRAEIEAILARYGASQFGYMTSVELAVIVFHCSDRMVRFELPMPDRTDTSITHKPLRRGQWRRDERTPQQQQQAYEQEVRQRWRALVLCVKAKLEAVESNITTFDAEFLAHIVLPGGKTVFSETLAAITRAYESGQAPNLLERF